MTGTTRTLTYPPEGLGAPKDRHPSPLVDLGLPAGTEVFSADDHISLAEDIFYERFPENMKDGAPRVMNVDGGWVLGVGGKSILVPEFIQVLTQYDPVPGSHTGDVEARLAALDSEGVSRELAFPNSVLALFGWPDREVRELCFRIYNEHIAEVQDAGSAKENILPPDTGYGFLWRLFSHWRFQERDGGVYVECRAISLTRDLPSGLGWAIKAIIGKVPKESLTRTLQTTRQALQASKR